LVRPVARQPRASARAASAGSQIGSTNSKDNVQVTNRRFAIELDFSGSAFTDTARALAIGRRAGTSRGTWRSSAPGIGLSERKEKEDSEWVGNGESKAKIFVM
jgi:hypothetical protein